MRIRRAFGSCVAILAASLLMMAAARTVYCQDAAQLINKGFESDPVQAGWEANVYGAQPRIERDLQVFHSGGSALRISAESPSDTALGQEIRLKPGRAYRLQGWVRTRNLDSRGAPVCGTLQVQAPGGRGILASGANHRGNTEWAQVTLTFIAPQDGRVRICLFFVGFGKGTGAAWFDGLELQTVDISASSVAVTRTPYCEGSISPYQYGQFIEYLCDLVPAMWAEKLYDGSFEGLTGYKLVYLKETDFKEKPWVPCGATNRADFSRDTASKVSGSMSQRISVVDGAPCTVGIEQAAISVSRGVACRFSCWMRAESLIGPVRILLKRGSHVLAETQFHPNAGWSKFQASLAPADTVTDGSLQISFRGPGTLWLDNASLMPENSVGGWRRDVVDAVRALKPGIIRFGGSALDDSNLGDFHWQDTIGNPDHRTPFRAWGGLQPVGPGLEEIVQFCRAVGAEPLICLRFTGSTPAEAARQVEYFNGAADTQMGALRARNGHAQPYKIQYWQVGNERSGPDYEARLPAFCSAIRKVDPSVRLLSSYPTTGVLHAAGDMLDYVCPHQYNCADVSGCEGELAAVRRMIATEAPGRKIHVGVTEWNTTAGDAGPRRAKLWSLENALACSRYHNLLHRNCDLVEIANRSNLTNSFCSGILQTDNHQLYKTPTYYAQQLYSTLAGSRPLKLLSDLPPEIGPDISATLSKDGRTLTIFAVNYASREITRPLDLSAFAISDHNATVWTLSDRDHAGEPDATNSFSDPERIKARKSDFSTPGARVSYRFPPYSLVALQWKVRPESAAKQWISK
jgi:alpha-N-arabinofuranosidase